MHQISNRISGGGEGRSQGFKYEFFFKELINGSESAILEIFELKYKKKIENFNFNKVKIEILGRSEEDLLTNIKKPPAADILLSYNNYFVGIDTKKPSSKQTQWVRKSIPLFLSWATNEEKIIFKEYFDYDRNHRRTYVHSEYKKRIIFDYINNHIWTMIKKRFRTNQKTWCDFLAHHENNNIKLISIDEVLEKEFILSNFKLKSTNYYFGDFISFKPYGKSRPDIQIQVRKEIFNSEYLKLIKLR